MQNSSSFIRRVAFVVVHVPIAIENCIHAIGFYSQIQVSKVVNFVSDINYITI